MNLTLQFLTFVIIELTLTIIWLLIGCDSLNRVLECPWIICHKYSVRIPDWMQNNLRNTHLPTGVCTTPASPSTPTIYLFLVTSSHFKLFLLTCVQVTDAHVNCFGLQCYKKILELEPDNIQGMHNLCVVYVERGDLLRAETCLKQAHRLAPTEDYVLRHLKIVQSRVAKLRTVDLSQVIYQIKTPSYPLVTKITFLYAAGISRMVKIWIIFFTTSSFHHMSRSHFIFCNTITCHTYNHIHTILI